MQAQKQENLEKIAADRIRNEIVGEATARQKQLADVAASEKHAREAALAAKLAGGQEALDKAKADLAALNAEAKDAAGDVQGPGFFGLAAWVKSLRGGGPGDLGRNLESVGTFNAAVAGQLGAKSLDKQQLDEQKEANRHLEAIRNKPGGLFG